MKTYTKSRRPILILGAHGRYISRLEFITFLEKTLIPDLRDSGQDATADDFETALMFMLDADLED